MDAATEQWQLKTREFVEQELIPCEVEAEMNGGQLPAEVSKRHKKRALELGFPAMDAPREYGGLALRNVEQVAVWEQLGRVTNALCWCFSEAQAVDVRSVHRGPVAALRAAHDARRAQGMLCHYRVRVRL